MTHPFQIGADVLLREHVPWIRGARVGLVAHRATAGTAELLRRESACRLTCLLGPEHGFLGRGGAGESIRGVAHPRWGIPIHSLYGATRRPTAAMLQDVDVLVFDLQDLAARCYTYVSTLRFVLEAAAEYGKTVIVADRPVPLPNTIDGPMLTPKCESFVGAIPAPLAYGMTPGETALWLRRSLGLDLELRVARMRGYARTATPRWWPAWVPPSPALRTWSCAVAYTATVFAEALPALDAARSTRNAFQILRAKWIRAGEFSAALNAQRLPGVVFRPHRSHAQQGVRLEIRDADAFLPVTTGMTALAVLRDLYGDLRLWGAPGTREDFFDKLAGTPSVRHALRRGRPPAEITAAWPAEHAGFVTERTACLLYEPTAPRRPTRIRSRRPLKAVVLAAGRGTRMLPLSRDLPKALMPLWGKPMLLHTLELLASWGVNEVAVNCHHLPSEILAFAQRVRIPGLRVVLSVEPEILGTGGALPPLAWFVGDDPFWMLNADVAADLDPEPLLHAFSRSEPLACLWLSPEAGPRTVELRRGMITTFRSGRAGAPDTFTFCGLQLLSPEIFRYLPPSGFASIVAAYETAMRRRRRIAGLCVPDAYWADMGTPEQYLAAHRDVRNRYRGGRAGARLYCPAVGPRRTLARNGVKMRGVVALGPDVEVGRGAILTDAVLWEGARVAAGVRLDAAIVGRQTRVTASAGGLVLRADAAMDRDEQAALAAAGWKSAQTTACFIGARGSARTFTRLSSAHKSMILVRYGLDREENALYAGHARFLRGVGFPVPRVLLDRPDRRLTLLEDAGDLPLEQYAATASSADLEEMYRRVLRCVARLHTRGTREARRLRLKLMPPFSRTLYAWELDLFEKWFLRKFARHGSRTRRALRREVESCGAVLRREPQVLLHRDLQSSNILLKRGRPVFIDFQGMRFGPAVYDLASLLCDPYVGLPLALQTRLLAYYERCAGTPIRRERFWLAAVQRLLQALGAYGRLASLPGGARFAGYVKPAQAMLGRALDHLPELPLLRKYAAYHTT